MIGVNGGNQLNIIILEVGMIFNDETLESLGRNVQTVTVHPLLVAPTSIHYSDASGVSVARTVGGSIRTAGPRQLRRVSLQGTFGAESRGMGLYIGNGDVRYQRFYKEVVRMAAALSQADVDENIDRLNGTPFISLLTKTYNPDTTQFYVNFYDFWHDRAFEVDITSFDTDRAHTRGGASGLTHYSMNLQEVGPLVTGSPMQQVIAALMTGLTAWSSVNDVINSYTLDTIVEAAVGPLGVAASLMTESVNAVSAQLDSVTSLLGASGGGSTGAKTTDGLTGATSPAETFFDACAALEAAASNLADQIRALYPSETSSEGGSVDWSSDETPPAYAQFQASQNASEVSSSAAFQRIAGRLFGMGDGVYHDFITTNGFSGIAAPEIGGTIDHVVSDNDTPALLEAAYGVSWRRIVAVNGRSPMDLLLSGSTIRIPRIRARGSQSIDGLPVLGSHVGQEAWGTDIDIVIRADSTGDLKTVSGQECLVQGMSVLVGQFALDLLEGIQVVPENGKAAYLTKRLSSVYLQDPRVKSATVEATASQTLSGAWDLTGQVSAINGLEIRTGGKL